METLIQMAAIRLKNGALREAEVAYRDLLARSLVPWSAGPNDLRSSYYIASSYEGLGDCARRQGDPGQAREWYRKCIDVWNGWPKRGVSSGYDRGHAAKAMRALAECR